METVETSRQDAAMGTRDAGEVVYVPNSDLGNSSEVVRSPMAQPISLPQAIPFVSHIPNAEGIGPMEQACSDSSLSSNFVHAFSSLTRCSDDETYDGMPPLSPKARLEEDSQDSPVHAPPDASASLPLKPTNSAAHNPKMVESTAPTVIECKLPPQIMPRPTKEETKKRRISFPGAEVDEPASQCKPPPSKLLRTNSGCKPSNENLGSSGPTESDSSSRPGTVLLARNTDSDVLNPLHAFVRQQIEVFSATDVEIQQPAPGRKNPIKLKQVGLRCIHCRDLPSRDRVKRAVCYPSSVGRVYHSVSDMKFDHFSACKGLKGAMRETFEKLKEENKKKKDRKVSETKNLSCSSSTAQYYHDSARQMGMVDARGGVFFSNDTPQPSVPESPQLATPHVATSPEPVSQTALHTKAPFPATPNVPNPSLTLRASSIGSDAVFGQLAQSLPLPGNLNSALMLQQEFFQRAMQQQFLLSMMTNASSLDFAKKPSVSHYTSPVVNRTSTESSSSSASGTILAQPDDFKFLNPIHCFVRRHVEAFSASKHDISAPAPGRKTRIVLGQVGLRCIHCARLPAKERVKRAVCYPPTVSGIYHAVSNMKFDHFAKCRGLPAADRTEFVSLRASCTRRSGSMGGNAGIGSMASKGMANSTAQYYHDSAVRLGLVDTDGGIRLKSHNISEMETETVLLADGDGDIQIGTNNGITALVIAANDSISAKGEKKLEGQKIENV